MSEGLTALASENLNPSLRSLLEDVHRGHIRVPRFQRPFVWNDSQRLELLRSIRDNMPIGSLLVWRTVKFKLESFPSVGPHRIPPIAEKPPATGWQYLLDGHQRVSTLLGLLINSANSDEIPSSSGDDIDWDIKYDLHDQDFVFAKRAEKRGSVLPLLPLWTLLDGRLVNRYMRDIRKAGDMGRWTAEDLDLWEERADQLSYRFQQCRVPIVVMVSDDLELAARTFQRINSLGTPMGEAHLVAALTWRSDFDLREQIDDLRQQLPVGWRSIDEGLFLQVCKGIAGLDITKLGQTDLVKRLSEDVSLLSRAGAALKHVLEWLAGDVGVVRQELMPYALQVVILATEMDRIGEGNFSRRVFSRWFWRTSWSEVFSTAAYREVRSEQAKLASLNDSGVDWIRDEDLPQRFDFRSARVRLFTLRHASQGFVSGVDGQSVDGRGLLAEFGRNAFVRLFVASKGSHIEMKQLIQGPGNRFLVDPNMEKQFRDRLYWGPDFTDDALASHFIDKESVALLRNGFGSEFLRRRQMKMEQWDKQQWSDFANNP